MIVVRVELWSAVNGETTELARMVVDNVSGGGTKRDYRCRTLRGRSKAALDGALLRMDTTGTQREGKVLRHRSLDLHIWHLIAKALSGMGYGR